MYEVKAKKQRYRKEWAMMQNKECTNNFEKCAQTRDAKTL